ncbi:MAG: Gamma-glutamyl phosphate reductase, partial [Deltaproteobacteria bacterium]|nr:Gamma-glutamyl phosphate reductase [Deltaproteobacteria bacterium]
PTETKNRVLSALAELLPRRKALLLAENEKDVRKAEEGQMPRALIDRLRIDDTVIKEMVDSLQDVIQLQDPVGEIVKLWKRPNGLLVGRMRIPIGVICIIYESRPNVTVEAFSLCLKSGNGVILKGGSEAAHSNRALFGLIREALDSQGVSTDVVYC